MNRIQMMIVSACGLAASVFAQVSPTLNNSPSRALGHARLQLSTTNPNLVEGREFTNPQGIAVDNTANPPIVYVADTGNNRVLAFRTAGLARGNPSDRVIGQRDRFTTFSQGPGTGLSTGLTAPTALAVDSQGNLYVVDSGNNRILRYPRPLQQTSDLLPVDLVIGQRSVSSGNTPNQGGNPTAKTLFLSANNQVFRTALAFDPQGNLWVSDSGNNRVLRFPVGQLGANTPDPEADLVLGQSDFVSRGGPQGSDVSQTNKRATVAPSGLAIDGQGRVYVSDAYSRVLFFVPPFTNGASAARVLGVLGPPQQGQPAPVFPNQTALGAPSGNTLIPPEGIALVGNSLYVADFGNNRIVRYGAPDTWAAETTAAPSPQMAGVIGQVDFFAGKPNRGQNEPVDNGFNGPVSIAFAGTDLYVVDTNNHRVLVMPGLGTSSADRVLGQLDFVYGSPNLVEGREFFLFAGTNNGLVVGGSSIALDRGSNPPRVYITDSLNNRILGFKDARNVRPGDTADVVIGQRDLFRTIVNSPNNDALRPSATGLFNPVGIIVDSNGDLWVADRGNGRVLRFPRPFDNAGNQRANVVLGQSSFDSKITDASNSTMNQPYGLALMFDGSIAVSDVAHHRVLLFRKPSGGDFQNGQAASVVFGQRDFASVQAGNGDGQFNTPTHLAADTDDRLYVSDTRNNRVQIFTRAPLASNGALSSFIIGNLSSPHGLAVSPLTGELWVANTLGNQAIRFPEYTTLILNPGQISGTIPITAPLALQLDPVDNLIVAEAVNRVSFYYAAMTFQNAANFGTRAVAPGMLAYIYRLGKAFQEPTGAATGYPWPTDLSDVQVFVNDTPAPLFRVLPGRIDIQVPQNAPTSGTAEWQVSRKSTGQILATGSIQMASTDPGFFTSNTQGTGQMSVVNQDGTVNSPTNGAPRGSVISLYGTGLGPANGAPADGQPATGPVNGNARIQVIFQGAQLPASEILYSGLTSFPGGWQVNIRVPTTAAPTIPNIIAVTLNDVPSNRGPNNAIIQTTVTVR